MTKKIVRIIEVHKTNSSYGNYAIVCDVIVDYGNGIIRPMQDTFYRWRKAEAKLIKVGDIL